MTTEQLNQESEAVIDESYESVQRSLQIAEGTRRLATDALESLEGQGQQLKRVQNDVDDISGLQEQNERHMAVIESPFGGLANKFRGKKRSEDAIKADKLSAEAAKKREQERQRESKKKIREQRSKNKKGAEEEFTYEHDLSDLSQPAQDKAALTDKGIDQLGFLVQDMKHIAIAMGDEIDEQNVRIDVLGEGIRNTETRANAQNNRVKRAMK